MTLTDEELLLLCPFKGQEIAEIFKTKKQYGSLSKHYRDEKWFITFNKAIPSQSESYGHEISTSYPVEVNFDSIKRTTLKDIKKIRKLHNLGN